jgi:hypothetical protein
MQRLRPFRAHAGALSRGEDHSGEPVTFHAAILNASDRSFGDTAAYDAARTPTNDVWACGPGAADGAVTRPVQVPAYGVGSFGVSGRETLLANYYPGMTRFLLSFSKTRRGARVKSAQSLAAWEEHLVLRGPVAMRLLIDP